MTQKNFDKLLNNMDDVFSDHLYNILSFINFLFDIMQEKLKEEQDLENESNPKNKLNKEFIEELYSAFIYIQSKMNNKDNPSRKALAALDKYQKDLELIKAKEDKKTP